MGGYKTSAVVVLDGERDTNEWKDVERCLVVDAIYGKGKWEGKHYQRHHVWCMYDDTWLYLAVRTFCPDTGAAEVHYPGDEPCDGFPLEISSEDKVILSTEILQDGIAMPPWRAWARLPTKQTVLNYATENFGLELKTATRRDGHEWMTEIRIPLSRLEHLGQRIFVEINGSRSRLHFYPKTRAVNWCPNAS